jgi:hypothetical protein
VTQSASATRQLAQRSLNRYGVLDNPALRILVVAQISAKELAQCLGVSGKIASSANEALCSSAKRAHAIARGLARSTSDSRARIALVAVAS